MTRSYLFVPGIFNDSWPQRAAKIVTDQGHHAYTVDYLGGFFANAFIRLRNRGLVRAIQSLSKINELHIVAHSHGCKRVLMALEELEGAVQSVTLMAAAVAEDADKNGINRLCYWGKAAQFTIYCSHHDKALHLANHVLGRKLGFDDLGKVGLHNLHPEYQPMVKVIFREGFSHSCWTSDIQLKNILGNT